MKKQILNFSVLAFMFLIIFASCEKNLEDPFIQDENSILPTRFKVDLPTSMSNSSSGISTKSAEIDTLKGNLIYSNLITFIAVGEGAADIVEAVINSIRVFRIYDIVDMTYVSDDDNRMKHLVIVENTEFKGRTWQYQLIISDVDSEGNADGGNAIQVFWNNKPVEGIAMIKPYNLNRRENMKNTEAMLSVEYSEAGNENYETYMKVDISGLAVNERETFGIDALQMFVGKNGDILDVYGNSNHPNAKFFTETKGYNWAFVASGNKTKNISVVELGLPFSNVDSDSRDVILKDYSIKNVLTEEINTWFLKVFHVRPNAEDLAGYLKDADAPGYFGNHGFIQGGTAPSSDYHVLKDRTEQLAPYNPKAVNDLVIEFK
ncbi:hypothetical protein [Saccharicrinis sp. FJH54]|uniref:hypothetical protein n=1 Tax=Saccharicrinis sp. FJH54 TaxID=3344665 RepID=UPI0035D3D971